MGDCVVGFGEVDIYREEWLFVGFVLVDVVELIVDDGVDFFFDDW